MIRVLDPGAGTLPRSLYQGHAVRRAASRQNKIGTKGGLSRWPELLIDGSKIAGNSADSSPAACPPSLRSARRGRLCVGVGDEPPADPRKTATSGEGAACEIGVDPPLVLARSPVAPAARLRRPDAARHAAARCKGPHGAMRAGCPHEALALV